MKTINKCDMCGEDFEGKPFPVVDENFNKQSGVTQCGKCLTGIEELKNEIQSIMELSKEQFDAFPEGEVFVKGEVENSPMGIYMTSSNLGKMLKWIAIKEYANDWTIYCHWSESGYEFVETNGDKVTGEKNIKKLVPCTDEVYRFYRL